MAGRVGGRSRRRRPAGPVGLDAPLGRTLLALGLFMAAVLAGVAMLGRDRARGPVVDGLGLRVLEQASACSVPGRVRLDYFYSPSCPACERTSPEVERLERELGDGLDLRTRCVVIHEGDREACIEREGREGFDEAARLSRAYGVRATPTLVFDCSRVKVGLAPYEELRRYACGLGEDVAGC